jgi:hypothetical protein
MRPWHDEVIVVMAPPKPPIRCFYNSIMRDTLSTTDQAKLSWTGNLLCLTSSLQQEVCPDLGGISRYAMSALLMVSFATGTCHADTQYRSFANYRCCSACLC